MGRRRTPESREWKRKRNHLIRKMCTGADEESLQKMFMNPARMAKWTKKVGM